MISRGPGDRVLSFVPLQASCADIFACDIRCLFKKPYSFRTVSVSNDPLRKQLCSNESVTLFTLFTLQRSCGGLSVFKSQTNYSR